MIIEEILELTVQKKASDLHISSYLPPVLRIDGELIRTNLPVLSPEDVETLLFPILTNEQRRTLEQTWELDFGYGLHGIGRFRVNIYKDKGNYAAAFRTVNSTPPTFESLGLPEVVKTVSNRPRGLILVTGPTGSGKSTTLAAMIDYINSTRTEHILTMEDPIEFVHTSKKSIVHQRELGQDTRSMANALRSALREDPDVILVGEMRDLETIGLALTAAETGHLVMGTLHTSSAAQTIDRVVDVFPEGQQQQIRLQLSNSLIAVFSQTLLQKLSDDGVTKKGRIMAQEIMLVTGAIANLIREQKTAQIYSALQTGTSIGMQTLDMALRDLVLAKKIDLQDAIAKSHHPDELKRMLGLEAEAKKLY
ncbi:TPA: type IV pilus twitching motility protein PilT [Candidatus Galligastranaerophilus intestinigallinarum]|nr:type IV pilus twitching motility protein PilT [Candidatus Galligastranaerophilus intestinigallinarum]